MGDLFIWFVQACLIYGKQGRKYEVYMLDLSQFSSERFKLRIKTLDFQKGYIIFRETGTKIRSQRSAILQYDCLGILRRGPLFKLEQLSDII